MLVHVGVADVLILFIGAVLPRSHPRVQPKHVMRFGSGDNPLKAFHLIGVSRCVVTDLVDTLSSPQVTLAMCFISLIGRPLRVKFT